MPIIGAGLNEVGIPDSRPASLLRGCPAQPDIMKAGAKAQKNRLKRRCAVRYRDANPVRWILPAYD